MSAFSSLPAWTAAWRPTESGKSGHENHNAGALTAGRRRHGPDLPGGQGPAQQPPCRHEEIDRQQRARANQAALVDGVFGAGAHLVGGRPLAAAGSSVQSMQAAAAATGYGSAALDQVITRWTRASRLHDVNDASLLAWRIGRLKKIKFQQECRDERRGGGRRRHGEASRALREVLPDAQRPVGCEDAIRSRPRWIASFDGRLSGLHRGAMREAGFIHPVNGASMAHS